MVFRVVASHGIYACEGFGGPVAVDSGSEYSELHNFTTSHHFSPREGWTVVNVQGFMFLPAGGTSHSPATGRSFRLTELPLFIDALVERNVNCGWADNSTVGGLGGLERFDQPISSILTDGIELPERA